MAHYVAREERQWLSSDDLLPRLSYRTTILSRSSLSCHLRHLDNESSDHFKGAAPVHSGQTRAEEARERLSQSHYR